MPTEKADPPGATPTDPNPLEAARTAASRLGGDDLRALRAWIDARLATPDADPGGAGLSDRETLALRLIALGYSNKEIAAQLRVSVKTVETYKTRAMEKLHIRTRVDIVRYAARRGWLAEGATNEK